MGLEPFLLTATLEVVVAQRLVRTICPGCRRTFVPDDEALRELGEDGPRFAGRELAFGAGCDRCFHTGYQGRTALVEILVLDANVRRAILEGRSTGELRRLAREAGMRSLRQSGLDAVAGGRTTLEEVLRETALS